MVTGQSAEADLMRRASVQAREDALAAEPVDETSFALADLFSMAADHLVGRGEPCESCLQMTVTVARHYLGEP